MNHEIEPVYNEFSEILILGTFPSVKSRESNFFYGHPQNRFWKVLSAIYNTALPCTVAEKKSFLLKNHIAVWDVIASCDIVGSSDSSIRNVVPSDINRILSYAPIQTIYTNGSTAFKLYEKHLLPLTGKPALKLPSTSPANAAYTLPMLETKWGIIRL